MADTPRQARALAGARFKAETKNVRGPRNGAGGPRAGWHRAGLAAGVIAAIGFAGVTSTAVGFAGSTVVHQPELTTRDIVRIVPQRHWRGNVQIAGITANVKIKDRVATTELAITLSNPTGRALEAELLLPVPDGSAIKQFGLDGLNEGTAELMTAEQARHIYRDIVRQQIDPGLLEFVGNAMIKSSVFPVPAQGSQVFRVTYEQVLPYFNGRVDYALPRSEALGTAGVAWDINVTLESGDGIGTVYSPSHGVESKTDANGVRHLAVTNAAAPGTFRLSYLKHETQSLACWLYPDPRIGNGDGGYFMLVADAPEADAAIEIKRELTIVIDRSGSMANGKLEQAVESAKQVIGGLNEGESFNILDYADEVERFRPEPVAKDAQSAAAALAYLDTLQARGGTNLHDALIATLQQPATEGVLPMVLFMTDGLASVGITNEATIRQSTNAMNEHNRRVFTFGVGHDVNAPLLSGIAEESRGAATYIEPGEDVEVKVGQVFAKLDGPVLTDTAFRAALASEFEMSAPRFDKEGRIKAYSSVSRMVLPGRLPDLFDGDQIVVFGQYTTKDAFYVELRGDAAGVAGENWNTSIKVDPADASVTHSFVPRQWARKRIAMLLTEIRKSAADGGEPNPELEDEIVRLSMEHGILTEFTSFIAAEEEDMSRYRKVAADGSLQYNFDSAGRDIALRSTSGQSAVERQVVLDESNSAAAPGAAQGSTRETLARRMAMEDTVDEFSVIRGGQNSFALTETLNADAIDIRSLSRVQQVADRTLFKRGTQWVDARILQLADETVFPEGEEPADPVQPTRTIEFDSDAYWELLESLAQNGRQSILAVPGEVVLLLDGEQVLVQTVPTEPAAEAESDPDDDAESESESEAESGG